jgi:hypothetical protein
MAWYWARVEIHKGAAEVTSGEYADLHTAMAKIGFARQINYGTRTFRLPPAEYLGEKAENIAKVQASIEAAAKSVLTTGQTFALLLAEIANISGKP